MTYVWLDSLSQYINEIPIVEIDKQRMRYHDYDTL